MDTEQIVEQARGTLEVLHLEELFNEELKCEADHDGSCECSEVVVGLFLSCDMTKHECKNALDYNMNAARENDYFWNLCDCGKKCTDCWKVIPI